VFDPIREEFRKARRSLVACGYRRNDQRYSWSRNIF